MILGGFHLGAPMNPDWPPEPEPPKPHPLQRTEPSQRDQEYADFYDWLSVIFGWVDDQERWWRVEDRIDLMLGIQMRSERHACHPTDAGTISGLETGFQAWPFFRCPCGLEWMRHPDSGWRLKVN